MEDRIKQLEIQKLIQEYTFLVTDGDYKKELIDLNKNEFLNMINERRPKTETPPVEEEKPEEEKEEEEVKEEEMKEEESTDEKSEEQPKTKKSKIDPELVSNETKTKIKKLYRDIVKLTHPDKVNSKEMVDLYMRATDASNNFDLFELYFICGKLNIPVELDGDDKDVLSLLVETKKKEIKSIEDSFIWKYINARTDVEREFILKLFLKNHP